MCEHTHTLQEGNIGPAAQLEAKQPPPNKHPLGWPLSFPLNS